MLADNNDFPPFSKAEYERRFKMIRAAMKEKGLDCLVIYGGDACYGNDRGSSHAVYVANYAAYPVGYVVFPLHDDPTLVVRTPLHINNARDIGSVSDVRASGFFVQEAGVGERLKELKLDKGRIGLVGSGVIMPNYTLPLEHYQYLSGMFPQAKFENVNAWFEELRSIKSAEELQFLERAGVLASHAYEHMILSTRRGSRHCDVGSGVQALGSQLGACYPLMHFSSTPMTNSNQNYPDPFPTARTVEDGHVVMTELVMGVGSYTAKIMGTYFAGEPTPLYRDLFKVAASVYETTISELKPGMTGRDTEKFVEPIKAAGYTTQGTLVMGWGNYMERPRVGAIADSLGGRTQPKEDQDFVFKPGQSLYIVARAATPDLKAGLWIGASCIFTETGLKRTVKHPVSELRII